MGRYIGTQDVRDWLSPNGSLPVVQNNLIGTCILWAESAIDNYTRRLFVGVPGTLRYNRYEQDKIRNNALYFHDDLHTLIGLVNGDGQTIPVGSVWLEPRPEGPPYRAIRLMSSYVWVWNTDADVIVSGTLGFSTVCPDDIKGAAVRLAAYYYRLKDAPGPNDVSGFTEGGETTIPKGMPDDVRYILSPYRSRSGGVV